ncbi:MAG: hypothetical protein JRF43_08490 [Deltaproteobacteria bacterium]|jgi:hypothetical protein|nr:hypothetical protein [Deltaproteobacteria bacterium]MCD4754465.1 hypothetical protein [Deltaproteobacteria bacterium]
MTTAVKTERITILGTPRFKAFLNREAKKEGKSLSELVRQRCEDKPQNEDEELLAILVKEVGDATARAEVSLEKGLTDAERVLAEIRSAA